MKPIFRNLVITFLIHASFMSFAQNGSFTGIGNASVMLYDFWALYNNQAGLADIESPEIGVSYENNYFLWQTGKQSIGAVLPTKSGNFAINGYRFGYSDYSENNFGLGYARNLGQFISTAVHFNYLYFSQSRNYGYKGTFIFQLGLIAKPVEKLYIGVHVYNPGRVKLEDYADKRVPTIFRLGMGYYFGEQVLVTAESEKDVDQPIRFKSGIQYEIIDHLFVRTGFLTNPNQFSLGLGYTLNHLTTDVAITTHQSLPLSSQISFKYSF